MVKKFFGVLFALAGILLLVFSVYLILSNGLDAPKLLYFISAIAIPGFVSTILIISGILLFRRQ